MDPTNPVDAAQFHSPAPPPSKTEDTQRSAWMLAGWLVLAPLLMLITVWLLTLLKVR